MAMLPMKMNRLIMKTEIQRKKLSHGGLKAPGKQNEGTTAVGSGDLLGVSFKDVFSASIITDKKDGSKIVELHGTIKIFINSDGSAIIDTLGESKVSLNPADFKVIRHLLTNSKPSESSCSSGSCAGLHLPAKNRKISVSRLA